MLKQHMKSFFALAMALLLVLGTLSACTITWESGKTNDASSDQAEALAEAQQDGGEELENLTIENDALIASCRVTDIYGNHYWLSF